MPLFRFLTYQELVRLLNITQVKNYEPGNEIVREGDDGDELFIMLTGKARVESAKAQMDSDVRRAREELRREVSELAISVAEKLVRRSLRDEDHRRIVEDTIARVGR